MVRYILAVNDSLDPETMTQALTPVTGPQMERTMLTYGQRMELEITAKAQRQFLLRLLTRRFGSLPATVIERVQQAGAHDLEDWVDRILDAASLEDVFAGSGDARG
jgi:hypothetical protein